MAAAASGTRHHQPPRPELVLGVDATRDDGQRVVLGPDAAAKHRHVIGLTGSGKSKLLAGLFVQLHNQGSGVALIDPHADLALEILSILEETGYFAQPGAYDRLWYLDFTRPDRALPFNILAQPYPDHAVARQLVEVWKRAWVALDGGAAPQLENILLAASLVLIQNRLPLTALPKLLTDQAYRNELLTNVHDPQVVEFFRTRFDRLGKGAAAAIESTLRRAFLLTFTPALRQPLGHIQNTLNLRAIMDQGISLLINLGGLDEATQRFLGCLLTVGFEVAALSRADTPAGARRPYQLILDEFSMFSAESEAGLSRVLDLARKYGLTLTLAHQTWSQINRRLGGALQNAVEIVFRLGYEDATWMGPRLLDVDPYLVKHVPDPAGLQLPRPTFVSAHEQQQQLIGQLTRLEPREALVRIGQQTTHIRTLLVPTGSVERPAIGVITEHYAQRLLRPVQQQSITVVPATDDATISDLVIDSIDSAAPVSGPCAPPVGRSPIELSADARAFLRVVLQQPELTVSQLYSEFGASVWKGAKLREGLVAGGYLVAVETRLGKGRRPATYLIPTASAIAVVPTKLPQGRGGPVHRHLQRLVVAEATSQGFPVQIEYVLGNGGIVDVHVERGVERVAIEISVTSDASRELEHILAALDAGYDQVISLTTSEAIRQGIARRLTEAGGVAASGRVELATLERIGMLLS